MKTKLLFGLALAVAGVTGYMGIRQANAFVVEKDDPRVHRPRTNGIFLGGYFLGTRGLGYYGTSSMAANTFRGGGPSAGK